MRHGGWVCSRAGVLRCWRVLSRWAPRCASWGIPFGLPHDLARPDEEKIAQAALGILKGDFNPHFFLYPTLFIYLTAAATPVLAWSSAPLGFAPVGTSLAATRNGRSPRCCTWSRADCAATSGVATIIVLYGAARELFPTRAALAAAAFLAVAFLHVRDSHFGVTDVPVTLVTVCAFWAAARIVTSGLTLTRACGGWLAERLADLDQIQRRARRPARGDRDWQRPADGPPRARRAGVRCDDRARDLPRRRVPDRDAIRSARPDRAFSPISTPNGLFVSGQGHGGSIIDPAREVFGGVRGWTHQFTFSLRYGLGLPF